MNGHFQTIYILYTLYVINHLHLNKIIILLLNIINNPINLLFNILNSFKTVFHSLPSDTQGANPHTARSISGRLELTPGSSGHST